MEETRLVISRVPDAPRSLVWKAWTDQEQLARWWGPAGYRLRVATIDLRPGGLFHYAMSAPGGQPMWGKLVYQEVSPTDRMIFVSSFCDEKADTIRNPMSAAWPLEIRNTLTLKGGPINATREEKKTFAGHKP